MSTQHNQEELSYDELMDIIVNNKTVPNVIDVPDIVLDQSLVSEATLQPRMKPWQQKKQVPIMDNYSADNADARDLVKHVELVTKSNSLEKLTSYYALEAEFQKQLQNYEQDSEDKNSNSESCHLAE